MYSLNPNRVSPGSYGSTAPNTGNTYGANNTFLARRAGNTGTGPAESRAAAIARYRDAIERIKNNGLKTGTPQFDKWAQIIKDVGAKYGYNWQQHIGKDWAPTKAVTKPVVKKPGVVQPKPPNYPSAQDIMANYRSPMTTALMNAFKQGTNTMRAYEPASFEGSPLYRWQKEQGQKDMEKFLASRGLTNSGAEVQAQNEFLSNLNATEAEKQRQYAEAEATRAQNAMQYIANYDQSERQNLLNQLNTQVDRRNALAQFEAKRKDEARALNMNTLLQILGLQSQSDIAKLAYSGMNQASQYTQALGNAMARGAASSYRRNPGTPPPQRPYDSSNLDILSMIMNYANQADNNSAINYGLGQFF